MDKKVAIKWGDGYSLATCPICGEKLEVAWLEFWDEMHFKNKHGIEKSELQWALS